MKVTVQKLSLSAPANLPKMKPGAIADYLGELRSDRIKLEKVAEQIKGEETRTKEYLMALLPQQELSKLAGQHYSVSYKVKVVPHVTDWPKVYAYITKNDAFDLLQRRPVAEAFVSRWEAKEKIPGVEPINKPDISIGALK